MVKAGPPLYLLFNFRHSESQLLMHSATMVTLIQKKQKASFGALNKLFDCLNVRSLSE